MPLTDPIREPLTEVESLIPGLAPTFAPQLPGIGTNKTLLYQTPGSSENSEQPNLIEPASGLASEFIRTEADTFIINKASDINSIPSANTSPPITNSTLRDTTNSEFDPLIGKLDSGLEDPLTNPNRIASNNVSSDSNKSATDLPPVNSSISNSELNKTAADTTAASDKLPENTTQLPDAAVGQSEPENSQSLLAVTADTTSEKAKSETTLVTTAETTSKPEEHQTPSSSETTLKSESSPNKTSPATASTTDKAESNKTSLTENTTANNLDTATKLEPDKASTPSTSINFDSNAFTVDEKGIIGIEFTSDGGWYTGQLAIVNLKGMETFVPGSEAFIKEAASRALSNSTNGYIAISDDLEGAYYTNPNSSENFNSGPYLGKKTFAMTPGDKFFFMLVPNGTVQQVYDNPAIGGDKKPLFSIATENPSDGFSIGQIADITGEGQLFVMEDMPLSQVSYRDYDDITFRVTGAASQILPLEQLAGSDSASIHSELVQKLKSESDKSEPLFTRESTVTNFPDKSPAQTPSITADNDQQKPFSTAATVANSDSQESPAKETSIVDKSDTQELQLIEQTASPPETPSVSPTELNSEIEQPGSGESLVSESAGAELIKTDTTTNLIPQLPAIADEAVNNPASPPTAETLLTSTPLALQPPAKTDALADNLGKELPRETDDNLSNAASQSLTNIAEVIPASKPDGTQENDRAVTETAAFLETEQLPQKTDALAVADFTATRSDTDIAVAFTAAELKTENPPAIAVNSLEPEPLISNSNSSVQTDSPIPALFSNSSETAAGTAQIASVETSVSPSTVKSPPSPTSNNYNSSSTPTETAGTQPAYSDTEIAPKPADISSGLLSKEAEESAQMEDGIADSQPNPTQPADDFQSNTNPQANLSITAAANSPSPGTFLVENANGQVTFDYQFDGGYYEGELGIFSLSGMEALTPGSPEFIAEAARRVLTNSTEGHLVIRDSIEGGKFTGAMPGEGSWGSDAYQGIKTFNMTPNDTFAVMLVPSGTVQSSLQFEWLWDLFPEMRPLFSIDSANPNDTSYVLPIADATGTGNTFALEDMSAASSDKDYNDLIFKISGATGNAPLLDTVINPDKEWRNTPLGQQLLAEANPSNPDNNPPVVSPTNTRTYTELETTISLENQAADAEGDPLTISVLNPVNGTVIFNPLTNKASFKPSPGFSGIASFDFQASDAFGSSSPARVTVNVSDVPLLNLDFVKRNGQLNAGENTELVVLGDFADQQDVVLPDSYLTYTSFNPEVAPIDETGKVTGLTNGTSILSASRNNLQAVTPIRIGAVPQPTTDAQLHQILAEMYGLDPYPDAVSLTPGATRKLSLGLNSNFTEANLTAASTGTRYFSNNSNILNVSPDGTITAVGIGDGTVTAIHGTAQAIIPVRVQVPQIGPTALGTDGGIINSNDGTLAVMIPPGALQQNTTVSIAPVNQQNLSLPLPPGFEFAGAFNLNFSDNSLNIPAQLAIPAPEGLAPGTQAYFMRKGAIPDATGTWNPIWLQEESGIVGDDGFIRTQSPPYPGVVRPGEYAVVYASPTGSATLVKGQLTLNYNFPLAFFGIIDPQGDIGQLIEPDNFVTNSAFTVTRDISSVQVVAIPKVGLPVVTEVGVQRNDDGTASFKAALNMPAPTTSDPTTPPVLQKAELKFKDDSGQPFENNEPLLFLTGGNILVNNASDSKGSKFEDLTVKFSFGNSIYEGTVVPTRSRSLGGNQYEVAVKVPDTVVLGASGVAIERKQNQIVEQKGVTPVYEEIQYNSNPIRLPQGAEYVFAALGGSDRLAVLNGKNPESVVDTTNSKDLLLAQIPVGTSSITDWAESTAVTSDGNRVYATLRNSGQVALVDPMVLRQVDTQPNTSGINPIVLPAGARPKSIVISPRDDYAYIGDLNQAKIYVLDINPNSATYHKVVETINVTSPLGLSQLAISSDGRRLFGTGSDNNEQVPNRRIYAINIDSKDRPKDEDSNPRKWHQQIGVIPTISETEGISATNEPTKMVFTNGLNLSSPGVNNDAPGFGVLEITSDDPLNFTASVSYAPLSLGSATDYFDVNEGVSVTVTRDGRYGFVAGRNSASLGPDADVRSGGNIGIIKDPLGPNPQLIGATRPIPNALTNDLVLSNDNKYLYGSYPALTGSGSVYAFDVEEIIRTLDNPGLFKIDPLDRGVKSPFFNATTARYVTAADFKTVPIDDINPAVSIAADYGILEENRPANQFTYGVLPGTTRAPVGSGGNLRDLSSAPTDWLDLKGPGATTSDLTPTFQWQFAPGWEDVKEVNLFVSTFEQGKGLLPWDKVVNLSDSALLPGLSETQKRQLLSKPWNGYDDFNPNRILTATWKKDTNKWYGHDGITPLDQPLNDPANTSTSFTLPQSLTAGQNYNFAVESVSNSGAVTKDVGQFQTRPPASNSPFSSVSVLTHGFTLLPDQSGIPDSFFQMANKIATVSGNTPENSGLIMRYDKPTGNWVPIDLQGRVITELTEGLNTSDRNYLSTLANNLNAGVFKDGKRIEYLNKNKPLVLLPEWSLDRESVIPDAGFSEGAADALFASMVQLDLALGGKVGEYDENNKLQRLYDSQGNLIRKQGDLFNSPLHFMGFSRGTVVNSEIVQRLGTFFPQAGGTSMANRDLQMTTIDPHDFYQPSLNLQLPGFISTNFSDFYEPKVQVWNNVTWADNYYQTVADPNDLTATPNGRALGLLPQEELNKNPKPAGLNFPKVNGDTLGQADREILLGTREGEPGREHSRIGFTTDDRVGGTHTRAFGWYAGTVDLSLEQVKVEYPHVEASDNPQEINDILSEKGNSEWSDPNKRAAKDWYDNANGEGVNDGWFFSVLGGGKEERQYSETGRVPVSFDNTLSAGMRGDYAVPTLFNGNFDQFIPNKSDSETLGRKTISKEIPGWSFHNSATSTLVSPINNLVEWTEIAQQSPNFLNNLESLGINPTDPNYQPNFALKLGAGDSITHNRFVVPDWGALRFDVHVPKPASLNDKDDYIQVYLETEDKSWELRDTQIDPRNIINESDSIPNIDQMTAIPAAVDLREVHPGAINQPLIQSQLNRIGYGYQGFETFQVNIPDEMRGKTARLRFQLQGDTEVYIDNVFFQSEHLKFGNPSLNQQEARTDRANQPNNYLIEKPQYAVSYNDSLKTPNWASYKLDPSWLAPPGTERKGLFETDWSLPFPDVTVSKDYGKVGEKGTVAIRGHLVPNQDRGREGRPITETGEGYSKDNLQTFVTTNVVPQPQQDTAWIELESNINKFVRDSNNPSNEVYVITGRAGSSDVITSLAPKELEPFRSRATQFNIDVPEMLWKVVLIPEKPGQSPTDITTNAISFGVLLPNIDHRPSNLIWQDHVFSVNDIEEYTGYNFFSNIPTEVQEEIENKITLPPFFEKKK